MYETEHVVWAKKRADRSRIVTCWRDEETEKMGEQKSENRDISSLMCDGAPCEPISTKFGVILSPADVITYIKNGPKISNGFPRPTGGKTYFSL